jgi:hypothetical protein
MDLNVHKEMHRINEVEEGLIEDLIGRVEVYLLDMIAVIMRRQEGECHQI